MAHWQFGLVFSCITIFLGLCNIVAWANATNANLTTENLPLNRLNSALDIMSFVSFCFMLILAVLYSAYYALSDPARRKQVIYQTLIATFLIGFVSLNYVTDASATGLNDGMSVLVQLVLGVILVGSVLFYAQRTPMLVTKM